MKGVDTIARIRCEFSVRGKMPFVAMREAGAAMSSRGAATRPAHGGRGRCIGRRNREPPQRVGDSFLLAKRKRRHPARAR